ncbi:MAG: glycosyltransferase family 2 protein [Alphaproteobacteria bacterium]|nr:glycosyltransferase family 2 protein [Alphaproteobacteria bacterium]
MVPDGLSSVSVVVVSYFTGWEVLSQAVSSILSQDYLKELILVDNGNPDEIQGRIKNLTNHDARLLWLSQPRNLGFAAGCNEGVKLSSGKYILLLNPDTVLPPHAFAPLLQAFEADSHVWMVGCLLRNHDGTFQETCIRNLITPVNAVVEALRLYRFLKIDGVNYRLSSLPAYPVPVQAISGAFMMMPVAKYRHVGGMDEKYFLHVEDMDLCYRVQEMEGKIFFVPAVEVTHIGQTSRKSRFKVEWHKTRGIMRYFRKHFKYRYFPGWLLIANLLLLTRFGVICVVLSTQQLIETIRSKHESRNESSRGV